MATISSHVLDSVMGDHARGIRVQCIKTDDRRIMFDVIADQQGRISETLMPDSADCSYELVFHSAAYFSDQQLPDDGGQVLDAVVIRLKLPQPQSRYHLPLMLSPHSYSIWWSGLRG